ncbi:hypothetical protein SAMN05216226_104154 [Halovenus aranensis]|uniref:ABC-2 type transport system permease protein n=2 Tax=Halovenus aranensis TaxID=890420 RepID=A0A1G8UB87_9EURY|nr:hypothetical protein SAMN05216226_104154 [Halovenus aranensis]
MLVEEFRMHTSLFGVRRFLLFPVFVAVVVTASAWLLGLTGTAMETVVAGVHLLVFFFGLQVGTAGLVGRDAMRNVLGEMTLLVFSGRTLPVSRRRLLSVFLLKDLAYYFLFFLTPITAGFLPLVAVGELSAANLVVLWLSVTGTFGLGAATSLTLVGVLSRSQVAVLGIVAAVAAGIVAEGITLVSYTPYGAYLDQTVVGAVGGFLPFAVLLVVGPLAFEPTASRRVRRFESGRFDRLRSLGDGLTARPLLEITRSSGSVWKVVFSLGVLFGVAALLLDRVAVATRIEPSAGIAFGTLLALGTFTTYNWVTQFDEPREYLRYPVGMDAVFRGKRRAFLALSLPTGVAYLTLAAVWYPVVDLLVGLVVFPLVSVYVFGVTAYLTGLSANELLFDTALFALYGAALAVVATPLLVAALAHGSAPVPSLAVAVALSVVAAAVGAVLSRRVGVRWHSRLRTE